MVGDGERNDIIGLGEARAIWVSFQRVVERLVGEGFDIAIVGAKDNHNCPVATKIAEQHQRRCGGIEQVEDLDQLPAGASMAMVGQVTGNTEVFTAVSDQVGTAPTTTHME